MKKYVCDVCGRDLKDSFEYYDCKVKIKKHSNKNEYFPYKLDMCYYCMGEFKRFVKNRIKTGELP